MSESEGYTPSTADVEEAYVWFSYLESSGTPDDEDYARFHRWLLAERARIWDEGAAWASAELGGSEWVALESPNANPYRKGDGS